MLDAIETANEAQFDRALRLIETCASGPIGFIGATFKPGVDDTGGSVYLRLGNALAARGHDVRIFDRYVAVTAATAAGPSGEGATPQAAASLAELIEFAQTLVLCHDDPSYLAELRRFARASQRLVDLTGVAPASSAAAYCALAG